VSQKQKNRIIRFTPIQRVFHIGLIFSFLTQGCTGMARLYIETSWGKTLAWIFGGYESCLTIHKYTGIFMLCWFVAHLIYLALKIDWRKFPWSLFGPDSLLPRLEDLVQAIQHTVWILGIGGLLRSDRWGYFKRLDALLMKITRLPPLNRVNYFKEIDGLLPEIIKPPNFDRWGYWEKFDYWGVFWGIPVLGITGLLLAYPLISTRIIPGWGLNVAIWIHRIEAILAMAHVFIIHFFIGHLRPHSFPMDRAMFEGSVDLNATRHERPAWVARLEETGRMESCLVPQASVRRRVIFYIFGYTAISIGFFLLIGGLVNSTSITW
jgi:cytochrome b subunit of formate dehydrogenase